MARLDTKIDQSIWDMALPDKADLALRWVREAKELNYDTEGSGLDWRRNFPVGYVIGDDPTRVVYIPVRHGGGGNLADPDVRPPNTAEDPIVVHRFERELAAAFDDRRRVLGKTGIVIGHHIKFDAHFSANAGVMLGRELTCTQNNEALLNEYTKKFSLDALSEYHGVTSKKGEELYAHLANLFGGPAERSAMQHFWRTSGDDPLAVEYAAGDGTSTHELYWSQKKDIEKQELQRVWEMENQLIWTLFRMERRGIKADMEYVAWLQEELKSRILEAASKLPANFNPRSPLQMKEWVTKAGHTDWPETELGNPSFTEKWLKKFPEGKAVVDLRKWTNLGNSFLEPLVQHHIVNGRINATLNQLKADEHGTVSGRLSCSHPNLQQIPKRDKEIAKLFRKIFVADEGMEFWEADYSQCEPRLYAHYAKEKVLIEGYTATPFRDVHDAVATLLGVERDPTAKRMNMGMFTGMYPKTFSQHMGWPLELATEKWNAWQEAFPGIAGFQKRAKDVLLDRGFVRTLLGRRGRLESNRLAYKGVSKIIQGGNADILKWFMLKLDIWLESLQDIAYLNMTVHDAFEWQAPATPEGRKLSEDMMVEMVKVQEPPFNLIVPFVVEADHGKNWAEATFGPEETWK